MPLLYLCPSSIIALGLDNASLIVGFSDGCLSARVMLFSTRFPALSSRSSSACGNQTDQLPGKRRVRGDCVSVPPQGESAWRWRTDSKVPGESEYEESPRVRVMYNTKMRRFMLLADRCILRNKSMVSTILSAINLPGQEHRQGNRRPLSVLGLLTWSKRRPFIAHGEP